MNPNPGDILVFAHGILGNLPVKADSNRPQLLRVGLWGLLGSILLLCGGSAILFPFFEDAVTAITLAIVPLLSSVTLAIFSFGFALIPNNTPIRQAQIIPVSGIMAFSQAVLLVALTFLFHVSEAQEVVLASLSTLFLVGITWHSALLSNLWIQIGIKRSLAILFAGVVNLISLVFSISAWYALLGKGSLTWDAMFFL